MIVAGGAPITVASPAADFGAQRLLKVNPADGSVIWQTASFSTPEASSCPAADATRVYVVEDTQLTARRLSDGGEEWSVPVGGASAPAVKDGRVYVVGNGALQVRDAETGAEISQVAVDASYARPPVIASGAILLRTDSGATARDPVSGAELWSETSLGPLSDLIATGDSVVLAGGRQVRSRTAATGAVGWTHSTPMGTVAAMVVADAGVVYINASTQDVRFANGHTQGLSLASGAVLFDADHGPRDNCCDTTNGYKPYLKLGDKLLNHYRYFEAADGVAPPGYQTQTVVWSGGGSANERESIVAVDGKTAYAWAAGSTYRLVARRDITPPAPATLATPQAGQVSSSARPGLSWSASSDNAGGTGLDHYEVWVDGGQLGADVSAGTTSFTPANPLDEGSRTWSVKAVDAAGNVRDSASRSFTVDTQPPVAFALRSPAPSAANLEPRPEFSWDVASDATSGVERYEMWIDGSKSGELAPSACGGGTCAMTLAVALADGNHSWSVEAVDQAGNTRTSATRSFSIDATPPSAFSLTSPADGAGLADPTPTLTWTPSSDSASGLDRYEVYIDGARDAAPLGASETSFAPSSDLGDGVHTWRVVALDEVGNDRSTETRVFTVDTVLPLAVVLSTPASDAVMRDATPAFAWSASSDNAGGTGLDHYEVWVDGGQLGADVSAGTTSFTPANPLDEGSRTWSVKAVDAAGNVRDSASRSFTVDTQPPVAFALRSPAPSAANLEPRPEFSWDVASDATSGVERYEMWIDGSKSGELAPSACGGGTCAMTLAVALADGNHSWSVEAVDQAGNTRTSATRSFSIDATPPSAFSLTSPADGAGLADPTPTLTWTPSSDSASGLDRYEVYIDGARDAAPLGASETSFAPSSDLGDGVHTWRVVALDEVGNDRSTETRVFTVDTVLPLAVVLSTPASDAVMRDATPAFAWSASSDNAGGTGLDHYEVWVDGGQLGADVSAGTTSFTPANPLDEGSRTWSVKAVDAAGNVRDSASRSFTVDTQPPVAFALRSPAPSAANLEPRPEFSWDVASDATSGVERYEMWIDGSKSGELAPSACGGGTCAMTLAVALADGNHSWSVEAVDQAGNTRTSATRSFSIDATPPSAFSLSAPADDAMTADASPMLTWELATDAGIGVESYEVYLDGSQRGGPLPHPTTSYAPSGYLADGPHTWHVTAVDRNGNTRTTTARSFTSDTTPPDTSLQAGPSGTTRARAAEFAFSSAESAALFECRVDGGEWQRCVSPRKILGLSDGSHTFNVRAVDDLGNQDGSPASRTWVVDATSAPSARLTAAPSPTVTGDPVVLDATGSSEQHDGTISGFQWDLNGDGNFERDTGLESKVTHAFLEPGDRSVAVRVTNTAGISADARATVDVRRAPPAGPLGISIDAGARYTNDPNVMVRTVWPRLSTSLIASNDGGFAGASRLALDPDVAWRLDSSGPERLPKTLYVRFEGGEAGRETYQDDIILDQTKPTITSAIVAGSGANASVAATRRRAYTVRIKAKDRTSGVTKIQAAVRKARPGRAVTYRKRSRLKSAGRPRFVRVKDGAGNWSRWHRLGSRVSGRGALPSANPSS